MPRGEQRQARKYLINGLCVFVGVTLITLCFVLLSIAYNNVKLCNERMNCNDTIQTKAKVFRIIAAVVFMLGFSLISMFWWRLRSMRAVEEFRQRLVGLERMAELGLIPYFERKDETRTLQLRNLW